MALVQCGREAHINPAHVSSVEWRHVHSTSHLVVTMADGRAISFKHQPHMLNGLNCYDVESALVQASLTASI